MAHPHDQPSIAKQPVLERIRESSKAMMANINEHPQLADASFPKLSEKPASFDCLLCRGMMPMEVIPMKMKSTGMKR